MKNLLFFIGRELTEEEIPAIPADLSHFAVRPGLSETPHCHRCGNTTNFSSHPCARCKKSCTYCRNCIEMGKISSCTTLYRWIGPEPEQLKNAGTLHWSGILSTGQKMASDNVRRAIENRSEHTVWAVAGAGKTEVLFEGIAAALSKGKRVCIAAPRADVVRELAPRLEKVFPHTPPAALYGGSPDQNTYSRLVISTTHQLFRYTEAFDVMIVDEVDAFPYTFDQSLQYAVHKACKKESALIYLTATPEPSWQSEIKSGKREATLIPARYHRQPLPVPNMAWCGNWKKSIVPAPVLEWVKEKENALVFYSHIDTMEKALPIFKNLNSHIESVHAADPLRKEKVEAMRRGDVPILLTTTILERGVTFSGVDVAVVGSEDRVFTESALVQIAGRAGRSADCPTGDITFFHYGKTKAMLRAIKQINEMNELGKERGLLDS